MPNDEERQNGKLNSDKVVRDLHEGQRIVLSMTTRCGALPYVTIIDEVIPNVVDRDVSNVVNENGDEPDSHEPLGTQPPLLESLLLILYL